MESDSLFLAAVVGMPAIALFSSLFVGKAVTSPPPGSWFYRADNYSDAWGTFGAVQTLKTFSAIRIGSLAFATGKLILENMNALNPERSP